MEQIDAPDAAQAGPAPEQSPADRATMLVADTLADLMGFWNFKPSMGRVWAVLYMSRRPLTADQIAARAALSMGSVSMTVQDLLRWGVIRRAWVPGDRRRHFEAETDIMALVTRVFRERELVVIDAAVQRFEEAVRLLDDGGGSSVPDEMLRSRFLLTRVRNLALLARAGRKVVEQFTRAGTLDLRGIAGKLVRRPTG